MIFRTCEYCGAHLDPGEACDCREEGATVERHCCVTGTVPHINDSKKEDVTDVIREKH